jgi:hypothetical protein
MAQAPHLQYGRWVSFDPARPDCPDPLTQIVTIGQVAERLGIKPNAVRELIRRGVPWLPPPAGKIGPTWVWRITELDWDQIARDRLRPGQHRPPEEAGTPTADEADGWWDDDEPDGDGR